MNSKRSWPSTPKLNLSKIICQVSCPLSTLLHSTFPLSISTRAPVPIKVALFQQLEAWETDFTMVGKSDLPMLLSCPSSFRKAQSKTNSELLWNWLGSMAVISDYTSLFTNWCSAFYSKCSKRILQCSLLSLASSAVSSFGERETQSISKSASIFCHVSWRGQPRDYRRQTWFQRWRLFHTSVWYAGA